MSDEDNKPLNLDIPDHLSYSEDHVWVDQSAEPSVVGVTDYAVSQLGDLVFIDLPEPGTQVQAGDEMLELESAKAVEPVIAPVAGTIRYVNQGAADDPSVVNNDPYGEGWLVKIELDDDEPELLDAEGYAKLIR
ncbi:glycine cleavage system protein H [Bifidobacterium sp. DSM 109958]|uniref:Glycine cleavage system H protein n=1 Tax=Bifidobacterium moraviense TaxID=2675323 RepID=A0A7Y0F1V3_9BIFI|nr:glycine cleavage system protein GcvH [Bifidobacterium sp. DSM 109958]NMN00495.1 glycine cleavage system protein H [Bifidobacterium sp. DSM 109958]